MATDEVPTAAAKTEVEKRVSLGPLPTTESDDLALALSGGGVRAALFSLGVLVGLIETQYHRRVRCVASVSGGSILNAALAHARRLGNFSTVEEFKPLASSLAMILAQHGTFVLSLRNLRRGLQYVYEFGKRSILAAIGPLLALLGFFFALSDTLHQDWKAGLSSLLVGICRGIPWIYVVGIVVASVSFAIYYFRGLFQEVVYREVVSAGTASSPDRSKGTGYVRDWGSASDADELKVMHVLVATDLLSGEPMYFSREFVHCKPYGWSPPNNILTTEALYSSAAFPVVFPPKRLRLRRLSFVAGEMPGDALPREVQLVDGGVYNNLGTDWFSVLADEQSRHERGLVKPCGGLVVDLPPRIKTKNIIVVNAGAPSRAVKRLLPGFLAVSRIMSVLYDNTVQPRIDLFRSENRPLIDIQESPLKLAESLKRLEGNAGVRARTLAERFLEEWPRTFWEDFSRDTASTRTKLSRAKIRRAARLMLHGYLSSLVLLHVRFGVALPERLRSEGDFFSLVGLAGSTAVPGAASNSSNAAIGPSAPPGS